MMNSTSEERVTFLALDQHNRFINWATVNVAPDVYDSIEDKDALFKELRYALKSAGAAKFIQIHGSPEFMEV